MPERSRQDPVAPGDVVGGKYRVERVLGAGAMGLVVAARHKDIGQLVALKFLLPELLARYPGIAERFLREARTVSQLQSQHVAHVHDFGVEKIARKQAPYLVMEYLEGCDLHRLADNGPIPVANVVAYLVQACDALAEAHALGVVHRDIKPDNLFLAQRAGRAPIIKVLDFGIASAIAGDSAHSERRLTNMSEVMGTPPYMSPEQLASACRADARSDIWSIGVVLYELVAGRLPFEGDSEVALMTAIMSAPPPSICARRPEIDPALEAVILHCLEKDPAHRFATAAELSAALAPFANNDALNTTWGSGVGTAIGLGGRGLGAMGLGGNDVSAGTPRTPGITPSPASSAGPPSARATFGPASTTVHGMPRPMIGKLAAVGATLALLGVAGGVAWVLSRGDATPPATIAHPRSAPPRVAAASPSETVASSNETGASPSQTAASSSDPPHAPTELVTPPSALPSAVGARASAVAPAKPVAAPPSAPAQPTTTPAPVKSAPPPASLLATDRKG